MKQSLTIALLLATANAVQLRDIFDAYDEESALEQTKKEDTIDPAALTAEIGGDDIARDVMLATNGIADQSFVQLSFVDHDSDEEPENVNIEAIDPPKRRRINDADGDGVEDNEKKSFEELDRHNKPVFGVVSEELHNTRHGGPPGHTRATDHPEPKENFAQKNFLSYQDDLADSYSDAEYLQLEENSEKLSMYINKIHSPEDLELVQWNGNHRHINDADGDGVEDNRHFSHDELDRFYIPAVFGVAEELHNTHHGNLPGHIQRYWDEHESEPKNTYDLIEKPWKMW